MVKRVIAPAEHHLLVNGQSMVAQFGGTTLSKFAVEKLVEHKITSRNFKSGLDFSDSYKARAGRSKVMLMLSSAVRKELGHLNGQLRPGQAFIERSPSGNDILVVKTLYDTSVMRYIRRINRLIQEKRLPLSISGLPYNNATNDYIQLNISFYNTGGRSTLHYYKLFCFIPQILTFFKTLSKKACFTDVTVQNIARSKFSGWVGSPTSSRNQRSSRSAASAANRS